MSSASPGISNLGPLGSGDLKDVIIERHQQMNGLNDLRFRHLESQLREKDAQVADEIRKYQLLKKDFAYNLTLLEGRDEELRRYDDTFRSLKRVIVEKDELISEIKSSISDLGERVKKEQQRSNDLETYYQEKLQELKTEHSEREESASTQTQSTLDEYERLLRTLRQKLTDSEDTSKRQIADLRSELAQREKLTEETISHLKTTLQQREVRLAKLKNERDTSNSVFESKVEIYEGRISSLEDQLKRQTGSSETHQRELRQEFKDREVELTQTLEGRISSLERALEDSRKDTERIRSELDAERQSGLRKLQEKEDEIKGIRNEVELQFYRKDKALEGMSHKSYSLEVQMSTLKERNEALQRSLDTAENELENSRSELRREKDKQSALKTEMVRLQIQREREEAQAETQDDESTKMLQKSNANLQQTVEAKQREIDLLKSEVRNATRRAALVSDLESELGISSVHQSPSSFSIREPQKTPVAHADARHQSLFSIPEISPKLERLELESSRLKMRNANLEEENERIRSELGQVRVEMERTLSSDREDRHQVAMLEIQVSELQKRLSESQMGAQRAKSELSRSRLRTSADFGAGVGFGASKLSVADATQLTHVNSLLTDLRIDYERERDKSKVAEENLFISNRENRALKRKVQEAAQDVKKMIRQREKLVALNNKYRAELDVLRRTSQSRLASSEDLQSASDSLRRQTQEVSRLGGVVGELSRTNGDLRREIDRLRSRSEMSIGTSDVLSDLSRRVSATRVQSEIPAIEKTLRRKKRALLQKRRRGRGRRRRRR